MCTSATRSLRICSHDISGSPAGVRSVATVADAVTVSDWCGSSTSKAVTWVPQ